MDNIDNIKKQDNKRGSKDILQDLSLKKNPFTVPEGYFNSLESELCAKIHGADKESSTAFASLRTAMAMAAMFALIFGLGYSVLYITGTHTNPTESTNITAEAGLILTENNTEEDTLSDEELLQYFGSYPSYNQETIEIIEVITPTVNKDEIEQYLIDTNVPSLVVLAALEK